MERAWVCLWSDLGRESPSKMGGPVAKEDPEVRGTEREKGLPVTSGRRKDGRFKAEFFTSICQQHLGGHERRERRRALRTATKTPSPEGAQSSAEPRAPGMGASLTI